MNLQQEDLRVQVAGLVNRRRSEGASGWLLNGGRSEDASDWVGQWRVI